MKIKPISISTQRLRKNFFKETSFSAAIQQLAQFIHKEIKESNLKTKKTSPGPTETSSSHTINTIAQILRKTIHSSKR